MEEELWFIIAGAVFIAMALSITRLKKLPLTSAIFYLSVGVGVGPMGLGLLHIDPLAQSALLLRVAELAVIISLFTAGLELRLPLRSPHWRVPALLATVSMLLGIGLLALAAHSGLGLPLGAAILLGAILAPTDPVLASEVQLEGPSDQNTVRMSLTAEAGLNDGTAFPFVMLGLGLLQLHDLGAGGWRWWVVDLGWATCAGMGFGWMMGTGIGRLVLYLRRRHQEAVGLDEFLALGLIALSYGGALLLNAYGFLSVFAAGLALRRMEMDVAAAARPSASMWSAGCEATDPEHAHSFLASAVLRFNEQLERVGEVIVVISVGALLAAPLMPFRDAWIVPLLVLVVRPVTVLPVVARLPGSRAEHLLTAWLGIRGVGSFYYLMYSVQRGIDPTLAERMIAITLTTVAVSILVHGFSATPLMRILSRGQSSGGDRVPRTPPTTSGQPRRS